MIQWFVGWLIRFRWQLFGLTAVLTLGAWLASRNLAFDRSIENMFAPNDPVLAPFARLKRTFGGHEIALAAYVDPGLLTPKGIDRLDRLSRQLAKVDGVESTFSLADLRYLLQTPFREQLLAFCEGYTIGPDRQTAGIVCVLVPQRTGISARTATVDRLRNLIEAHDAGAVLTGEPVMVVDGFRYLESDGVLLGSASTVLLMLTILVCFRSLRWVVVPMGVVYVTLVCTQALLVFLDVRLSMVSSMLWAIVTVIGVATMVHLIVGFRSGRLSGQTPRAALESAGIRLAAPIFWACVTDAAGFGSLLISRVGPVQDFGLMMALGALVCLVAIATVAPALSLWGQFDADPRRAWGERGIELGLRGLTAGIERHPRLLGILVVLGCGLCCLGSLWLEVETDFTRNFRRSSPIVRSYQFVEERLGGAGVWDVIVPAPDKPDAQFLERLALLEKRLRKEVTVEDANGAKSPALTKVLSIDDALDLVPLGRMLAARDFVASLDGLGQRLALARALYGRDPAEGGRLYLRIMLRAKERQPSIQKRRMIDEVQRISGEVFPGAEVTGAFVLVTGLIESTTRDQWRSFIVAILAIGFFMGCAFRSLPLVFVALVPNVLPIMVVMGCMGWLGKFGWSYARINMGSAMIAAVSMGMAVDSSVHYITDYLRQRKAGQSVAAALHAVHQTVGRAMVFSTLALMVGFTVLVLSQFVPTIYFGVLVSLSLLGSMLGNLIILPLLLKLIDRDRGPKAPSPEGTAH